MILIRLINTLLLALILAACTPTKSDYEYSIKVSKKYPHLTTTFTQGFIINNGKVTESSGIYGKSFVRSYKLSNNQTLASTKLPGHYFAEGLTQLNQELYVLSWKENTVLVLNPDTLRTSRRMSYQGEGWGITNNGSDLIMSNGSAKLSIRSATTFKTLKTISVYDENGPVKNLNELEWIDGQIFANIWQQDLMVAIDPSTGEVTQRINLAPLREHLNGEKVDVLNGIAWDSSSKQLYLTGKYWPWIFAASISKN